MKKKTTDREKKKQQQQTKPHLGWKKAIVTKKKSPEVTSKGEDSNKHFNPVKNYFVFSFLETNYSLRGSNCN